jgi:polyphenol oxidase
MTIDVLTPRWPAPERVRAAFTLRQGGVSTAPHATLNLAAHTGDESHAVAQNRRRLRAQLELPAEPLWLEQVHGTHVIDLDRLVAEGPHRADAALTRSPGRVCAVLVADCLSVLLAERRGSAVAAVHAGWRGLAAGVLEAAVQALAVAPTDLMAWIGPGIGAAHYEVGAEVRAALMAAGPAYAAAFAPNARGRWQCDLPAIARHRLHGLGVRAVYAGEGCTFAEPERFFSYRRDGRCGRMAALIWLLP